jgi:isoleucyl-tRNA synthetase
LTLQSISKAIAPVVCHTAEDIRLHWMSQIHKCDLDQVKGSIFTDQDGWLPNNQDTWHNDQLAKNWQMIRHLRFEVNRLVEKMRAKDLVGSQLECNVTLLIRDDQSREQFLQLVGGAASREGLENVFLCSGVDIVGYSDLEDKEDEIFRGACQLSLFDEDKKIEVELIVSHAKGHKCPRCWKFAVEVDEHETNLCFRCATATGLQKTSDLASQIIQED